MSETSKDIMKRCTKCDTVKSEEDFAMQPSRGRRRSECKVCKAKSDKEWLAKRKQNPPERTQETKKCSHCHEVKSTDEFSPGNPGYYQQPCKPCKKSELQEKREEQRKNDPEGSHYRPWVNEAGITMKRCSRCHFEMSIDKFRKRGKYYHPLCLDCNKKDFKERYDGNPDKYRAKALKAARKNPEKTRVRFSTWYQANRSRRLQYYQDNKERRAETTRLWSKANSDKKAESSQRRRARQMSAPRIEEIDRQSIIERDKWTCYLCGCICTVDNVTLDHVVPLILGGDHTSDNLRVACYPCNCRKGRKPLSEFLSLRSEFLKSKWESA